MYSKDDGYYVIDYGTVLFIPRVKFTKLLPDIMMLIFVDISHVLQNTLICICFMLFVKKITLS